jgi:hypothetical protein
MSTTHLALELIHATYPLSTRLTRVAWQSIKLLTPQPALQPTLRTKTPLYTYSSPTLRRSSTYIPFRFERRYTVPAKMAPIEDLEKLPKERQPIVISGPSGSGKSTMLKKLFEKFPDRFMFSVSRMISLQHPYSLAGEVNLRVI